MSSLRSGVLSFCDAKFCLYFYRPQTKLWEGNVLHLPVRLSFCSQGGGDLCKMSLPVWLPGPGGLPPGGRGFHPGGVGSASRGKGSASGRSTSRAGRGLYPGRSASQGGGKRGSASGGGGEGGSASGKVGRPLRMRKVGGTHPTGMHSCLKKFRDAPLLALLASAEMSLANHELSVVCPCCCL